MQTRTMVGGESIITKQNLVFSICLSCKAIRTVSGWVKVVDGIKIPYGLVEEFCPSCLLDKTKEWMAVTLPAH